MLQVARQRGFQPEFVLFDSWHARLESLKLLRSAGWQWLTRLEHRYPSVGPFCPSQRLRHDQGVQNPDIEDWASRDLYMSDLMRLRHAELSWMIETCHRGVKQFWVVAQIR
ncbi:MAG: hypothetical protein ACTFAK_13790 [Candidatus Electronema sp. VV]